MRKPFSAFLFVTGLLVNAVLAQAPKNASEAPSYELMEYGVMPRPVHPMMPGVQEELKITESQKKEQEATSTKLREKLQKARSEIADREKFLAAREVIFKEMQAAIRDALEPAQRERLDQIQLQALGPLAFNRSTSSFPVMMMMDLPDPALRLKLTDEQVGRIRTIAEEGMKEIQQAGSVPILMDLKNGAPTLESVRKLVESPEFQASKQKTRERAGEVWASVMRRIEEALTPAQRTAYHEMLGPSFDLTKIRLPINEPEREVQMVANALNVEDQGGGGGGQRSDPNFDTKVARPAYKAEHPRVLFDEAHNNFHTTTGRYKPFAEVIANDGCNVIPNKEKFTKELLAKGDILIIANALGAGAMGQAGAEDSAFTDTECDAVRDWVQRGGSLLLITDHAPFGSSARSLAKRFGVEMSNGFTADSANSEGGDTSLVFTRKNNLLGDHPIMHGRDDSERINRVQTFTGTSLKGPAGSVALLKLADTAVDQEGAGTPRSAAGRVQGLAFVFGKGRVVVMGEAAELSAQLIGTERFGMNVPGLDNRQMALNILHWLSGLLQPREKPEKKAG